MAKIRKVANIAWQDFEEGVLLIDPETQKVHELNSTASFIWQSLDRPQDITSLSKMFVDEFVIDFDEAKVDVQNFIEVAFALQILEAV